MATVQERTGRTLAQPVPTQVAGVPQRAPARQPWGRRLLLVALLTGCSLLFLVPVRVDGVGQLAAAGLCVRHLAAASPFAPENYRTVWEAAPLLTWLMNSMVIGVMAALAVTVSSAFVAFGFAYFRFPAAT